MIKNYSTTDDEAPIYWIIKLSNVIYIIIFWFFPWVLTRGAFSKWENLIITILYLILTIWLSFVWYVLSEWRIDGRKIYRYFMDSLRKKSQINFDNYKKVKKYDIQELIEWLKKDT